MNLLDLLKEKCPSITGSTTGLKDAERDQKMVRSKHPGVKRAWMLVNKLEKAGSGAEEILAARKQYQLLLKLAK